MKLLLPSSSSSRKCVSPASEPSEALCWLGFAHVIVIIVRKGRVSARRFGVEGGALVVTGVRRGIPGSKAQRQQRRSRGGKEGERRKGAGQ